MLRPNKSCGPGTEVAEQRENVTIAKPRPSREEVVGEERRVGYRVGE